jgi:diguanylate cyclase (GGDEF)-like protein
MDSNVGLAIQSIGILLITLLSVFMRSSIKSAALKYWTVGWASLSLALLSLIVGFHATNHQALFYSLYFMGEYTFGLLFIAGCRNYVSARAFTGKQLGMFLPFLVVSALLPFVSADFNDLFMVHATIMAVLFATSFLTLRFGVTGPSPGTSVISVALLLLTAGFLHYLPLFGARKGLLGMTVPTGYLQYTSICDMILEIVLGFGTMMLLMEAIHREAEKANRELTEARDKLELLARMDPLTEALNRHAFHSLLSRTERGDHAETFGCVAVLDIDNLKPINDTHGHAAGDKAIRAVARAMRSLIRADDMLFRWGGDEFLVLMFNLSEGEVSRRIATLNGIIQRNCEQWTGLPIKVSVSYGVAGFSSMRDLAVGIEAADQAMYAQRQKMRGPAKLENPSMLPLTPTVLLDVH